MAWQKAMGLAGLSEGGVVGVDVAGTPVALYLLNGVVHATHGICTHAFAFLAEGWVEGGTVECPLHQGQFDIRSGRALCAPLSQDLKTYAVRVDGDDVLIDLDRPADSVAAPAEAAPVMAATTERAVILGAGQAAAAAIRALRASGFGGSIDLVGAEAHLPYERPPLSKDLLAGKGDFAACCRLTEADAERLGVTLHLGIRATGIDAATRRVTLDGSTLDYDKLLLATGGRARRLALPGSDLPGVLHLRTLDDARAISAAFERARRVVVLGGGFIGLELASAARARGIAVTLLEREDELMARLLPAPLGRAFRHLATRHGVEVRCGVAAVSVMKLGDALGVVTSGGLVEADAVLVGIGLEAETALAQGAGCMLAAGGILVDAQGRTSMPGIWAAGDCAASDIGLAGRPMRLESWHNAEEGGAAAGRDMAGAVASSEVRQPWFWTDQFDLNIQVLGLPGRDDSVALVGDDAMTGAVYRTLDTESGRVTAIIAFSDPPAIRAGRAELAAAKAFDLVAAGARLLLPNDTDVPVPVSPEPTEALPMDGATDFSISRRYAWPAEGLTRIPDWVYTDETIYQREVERIFHGRTWNYVALEAEIPNSGDFIRSNVGPTPVVVARAEDGSINVFENRCVHRAAEFCRELDGNAKEFVCPYHQWTYDLKGNLAGVPFRRGVAGKGGMPADFDTGQHGLKKLRVTTHRGVVFASYSDTVEPLADYLGPDILREFEATFDGRKLTILGHYRHTLPGNWKLYHENLKDPYHATLLHTFLVTFGLLVAGNKSLMLADPTGRHGAMCSAKSTASVSADAKKEMRAYKEGMTLSEPRFMDFIDEFDSPWSVTMSTIWPNLIVQREMNTLGIRQIVPTGPNEFIMKWTMFGFEGDDDEMTRHRLRQGNLMGPAGFLGLEDNEAIKFVQDGMKSVPGGEHLVMLDPGVEGTSETLISEAAIRAMYRYWRTEMGL